MGIFTKDSVEVEAEPRKDIIYEQIGEDDPQEWMHDSKYHHFKRVSEMSDPGARWGYPARIPNSPEERGGTLKIIKEIEIKSRKASEQEDLGRFTEERTITSDGKYIEETDQSVEDFCREYFISTLKSDQKRVMELYSDSRRHATPSEEVLRDINSVLKSNIKPSVSVSPRLNPVKGILDELTSNTAPEFISEKKFDVKEVKNDEVKKETVVTVETEYYTS